MQENLNDLFRMLGARLMHTSDQHEVVCVNPSIFENLRKAVMSAQEELEALRAENAKLIAELDSFKKAYEISNSTNAQLLAEREAMRKQEPVATVSCDRLTSLTLPWSMHPVKLYAHPLPTQQIGQEPVFYATKNLNIAITAETYNCGTAIGQADYPVPLYAHPLPAQQIPEGYMPVPIDLIQAVAHVGVDFGYGEFYLDGSHIEQARQLLSASQPKGDL